MEFLRSLLTFSEWLAWRRLGIGSSDAAGIMETSKWTTAFEIFLEKSGRIVGRRRSFYELRAMERGRRLEAAARADYERRTGILMPAYCVVNPTRPRLLASTDGLNRPADRAAEFKVPGKVDHLKALKGIVPDYYLWQCRHILAATEVSKIDYFSFRNGEGAPPITIHREWKTEKILLDAEDRFLEMLDQDRPPIPKQCRLDNVIPFNHGVKKNVFVVR